MYFALGIFVPKSLNDKISAYKRFLHDYYCISWTMRNVQLLPPSTIPNPCKFFVKRRAGLMLTKVVLRSNIKLGVFFAFFVLIFQGNK